MENFSALFLSLALSSIQTAAIAGDGSNGGRRTITANGPVSINLSGGNGDTGRTGSDGSRGKCGTKKDSQGRTVRDDRRGGNGSRGGSGGDGGNGGHLTVLFNKLEDISGIKFVSVGGHGGRGGAGGDGGYGCPRGSDGSRGSSGSNGRYGSLYLVASEFQPYQNDTSNNAHIISSLLSGKNLVKHIWSKIEGKPLISPESVYGNSFMLQGYEYGTAKVILKDPSKIDPRLLEGAFDVKLNEGVANISVGSDFKIIARHSEASTNAVLEIERLYSANEFNSIGFETVLTKNANRYIQFKTKQNLIPQPTLSLKLKIEVKGSFFKYHEIFNDEVPASLIEAVESGYLVDMDALSLARKIKTFDKIRLTMNYKIQEMELEHSAEEVWVVKLNGNEVAEKEMVSGEN